VLCLRESAEITLIDGEHRAGQRVRGYSWVITSAAAQAATKAHIDRLRALCVGPPAPPFAIILSDSGQTHQLYRGAVNHDRSRVVVTLEAERVEYNPADLAGLLAVAGKYAAATGKPALSEPISAHGAMKVIGRYRDGESILEAWNNRWSTPPGRLAAWLCPNREACDEEYPSDVEPIPPPDPGHRGVPAQAGGAGGPARPAGRRGRAGEPQAGRQPTLFDLG
jgi:hypothetical protein